MASDVRERVPTGLATRQLRPRRIRLADVDGSGVVDLLHLGNGEVGLWLNEAGNHWSARQSLPELPHVDGVVDAQAADLLGNGTTWGENASSGGNPTR